MNGNIAKDSSPGIKHRWDLDGLRAVAAIAVMVSHGFPEYFYGGFTGIDIFFVLSGFLITGKINAELATSQFSLATFYARRIRRIFPSLIVVTLPVVIVGYWILLPREFSELGSEIASSSAFIGNVYFWRTTGYLQGIDEHKPMLHLWTLGLEEQFYALWPFLFFLKTGWRWFSICVLCIVSLIAWMWLGQSFASFSYYMIPTRFWEFATGGILTLLIPKLQRQLSDLKSPKAARNVNNALSALGIILIAYSMFAYREYQTSFFSWSLLSVAGACAIIGSSPNAIFNLLLSVRPLRYLSKISYPLYLWHWPLLAYFSIESTFTEMNSKIFFVFAVAIALSIVTHHCVEAPLRFAKKNSFAPTWAIALVMIMVALLGVFMNLYTFKSASVLESDLDYKLKPYDAATCPLARQWEGLGNFCKSSGRLKPQVALIGDSHADHLFAGLSQIYEKAGLLLLGRGSCAILLGVAPTIDSEQCERSELDIVNYLRSTPSISLLIISQYFGYARKKDYFSDTSNSSSGLKDVELFRTGMERFIKRVSGPERHILLLKDNPEFKILPRHCIENSDFFSVPSCKASRNEEQLLQAKYDKAIDDIVKANAKVSVLDLKDYLCENETCPILKDGILLYRDQSHLSERGSAWLSERMSAVLTQQLKNAK